jgi:hypothetical protein
VVQKRWFLKHVFEYESVADLLIALTEGTSGGLQSSDCSHLCLGCGRLRRAVAVIGFAAGLPAGLLSLTATMFTRIYWHGLRAVSRCARFRCSEK